jgi:hypothetical protein
MNCLTGKDAWARKHSFLVRNLTIQKSQKSLGPQIRKLTYVQKVLKFKKGHKFSDLRFGQLISGPPPLLPAKKIQV